MDKWFRKVSTAVHENMPGQRDFGKPIIQGSLFKRAVKSGRNWKRRFFRLYPDRLSYSTSERGRVKGSMVLTEDFYVSDSTLRTHGFMVSDFETTYYLAADSAELKMFWMHAIAKVIRALQEKVKYFVNDEERSASQVEEDYQARLEAYQRSKGDTPKGADGAPPPPPRPGEAIDEDDVPPPPMAPRPVSIRPPSREPPPIAAAADDDDDDDDDDELEETADLSTLPIESVDLERVRMSVAEAEFQHALDDAEDAEAQSRRALEKLSSQGEIDYIAPLEPIEPMKLQRVVTTLTNETEHFKQLERQLRAENESLRASMDAMRAEMEASFATKESNMRAEANDRIKAKEQAHERAAAALKSDVQKLEKRVNDLTMELSSRPKSTGKSDLEKDLKKMASDKRAIEEARDSFKRALESEMTAKSSFRQQAEQFKSKAAEVERKLEGSLQTSNAQKAALEQEIVRLNASSVKNSCRASASSQKQARLAQSASDQQCAQGDLEAAVNVKRRWKLSCNLSARVSMRSSKRSSETLQRALRLKRKPTLSVWRLRKT